AYTLYELCQALICFAVMFLPALCLGTTLPLASRVATAALSVTGRSVGKVFAVNTIGTVLGAVLGGLVFLPYFGLAHTFAIGIALNALIGTAILVQRYPGNRLVWIAPALVLVVSFLGASSLEPRWRRAFSFGMWRGGVAPPTVQAYRDIVDRLNLKYHRDGAGSTVAVIADQLSNGREQLSLTVNGKTDATSVGDMSTQVLTGQIPMMLSPGATDALVVGIGSGVTVGAILCHQAVTNVDVVEISPEVSEVARTFFGPVNNHALDDPRVHLAVEDAKTFLRATPNRYDVIVTEPSNPWMAGVAAVFSHEYYQDCAARLKPGGIVAQWLQVYETNDRIVDMVVNTFSSVFPYVGVWQAGAGDLLLVGSLTPRKPDLSSFERSFNDPVVRADLARVGVQNLTTLLMQELIPHGDAAYLPETEPETPVHSDFKPVLEYEAQRAFFQRGGATKLLQLSEPRQRSPRMLLNQVRRPADMTPADFGSAAELFRASSIPDPAVFRSQVWRWLDLGATNVEPLTLLISIDSQVPLPDLLASSLGSRPEFRLAREQGNVVLMREQAAALMDRHRTRRTAYYLPDTGELEAVLGALIEADTDQRRTHRARLAEVLWDRGQEEPFLAMARQTFAASAEDSSSREFELDPRAPRQVIARMLLLFEKRGQLPTAVQVVKESAQNGFLGPTARYREPLLEYHARRILGSVMPEPTSAP
ncbi:MAG: fused MFS/spermidine synthase, partial [Verrucomicrobia bacterium]|nr:fused MFS/spermidine synthase [Verrucomicrobiota bacterium]